MILLIMIAVIALMIGMLIIESNATDRQEKRADIMTDLYNKNCIVVRRQITEIAALKAELESKSANKQRIANAMKIIEEKKQRGRKSAVRRVKP